MDLWKKPRAQLVMQPRKARLLAAIGPDHRRPVKTGACCAPRFSADGLDRPPAGDARSLPPPRPMQGVRFFGLHDQ
jgi:hypothetical protein